MLFPTILKGKNVPKHIAIEIGGISDICDKFKNNIDESKRALFKGISGMLEIQFSKEIPVLSISIKPKSETEQKTLRESIKELLSNNHVHEKKVRILVIGDWYALDTSLVDELKSAMDKTKNYDSYFLNLCISYNGRQELLTAIKLLIKKIELEKLTIDAVSEDIIKQNLPSSYLPPPELIIMLANPYQGLLLWDSIGSIIFFEKNKFLNIEKKDIEKAIDFYNEHKKKTE